MNEKHDVELMIMDGSTVLTRLAVRLDHLPLPGEEWFLDKGWGDLASRFQEKGEVTRVAIRPGEPARVEVQARFSRSQVGRPVVILNEYRIPEELRNDAAQALLRHPSSPSVIWQASPEPRTVLQVQNSAEADRLKPIDCEDIVDAALAEATAAK